MPAGALSFFFVQGLAVHAVCGWPTAAAAPRAALAWEFPRGDDAKERGGTYRNTEDGAAVFHLIQVFSRKSCSIILGL